MCSEEFLQPTDLTTPHFPDFEIPKTGEDSSAIFTYQNICDVNSLVDRGGRNTSHGACVENQELFDLTADDGNVGCT